MEERLRERGYFTEWAPITFKDYLSHISFMGHEDTQTSRTFYLRWRLKLEQAEAPGLRYQMRMLAGLTWTKAVAGQGRQARI